MVSVQQESKRLAQGLDVVRDLVVQLRKVLVSYSQFEAGHATRKHLDTELFAKLSYYCTNNGALILDCSPFHLSWENEIIYRSTGHEDAIAHALYCDGISQVTFKKGLLKEELAVFCQIWSKALLGKMSRTQNIVTETWEADLTHVTLKSERHFDLILHSDSEAEKAEALGQEIFSQWLTPQGRWRKTKRQDVLAHVVTEKEETSGALDTHRLDGLASLTSEDFLAPVRGADLPMTFVAQEQLEERRSHLDDEAENLYAYRSAVDKIIRIFWQISQKTQAQNSSQILDFRKCIGHF